MYARYLYLAIIPLLFSGLLFFFSFPETPLTINNCTIQPSSLFFSAIPAYFINFFIALLFFYLHSHLPVFGNKLKQKRWFESPSPTIYLLLENPNQDTWEDIKKFLQQEPIRDAIYSEDCPYIYNFDSPKTKIFGFRIILCALVLFFHIAATLLVVEFIDNKLPDNFTYFGALITASIALASLVSNQRINARTKNRIKWINELREEMSAFFGVLGWLKHSDQDDIITEWKESCTKYTPKSIQYNMPIVGEKTDDLKCKSRFSLMSKLELMLNPSERAHRTLISLMRLALGNDRLRVDTCILKKLGFSTKYLYDNITDKRYILDHKKYIVMYGPQKITQDELISMIFRLAQIVLKREWEQVKNIS